MLWGVGVVVLVHVVAFVAPVMLSAARGGTGARWLLALLTAASAFAVGAARRSGSGVGLVAGVLVGTWLVSGATAWLLASTGVF